MKTNRRILEAVTRPDIVRRSLWLSLIVGTVLVVINQGDIMLYGTVGTKEFLKILLTYAVPYCVSTYSSLATIERSN